MQGEVPTRISHFKLDAFVARGGVGVVYQATDETLGRQVALKVIDDPEHCDRLIDEARAVSRLKHPRIADVYEAGRCDDTGLAFVAFEWVPGISLRALLRAGPLTIEDILEYAEDVAAAVAHAHEHELVHGDLKADNVVVGRDGHLKLLDFGLAAPFEGFEEGEMWGTPACMAPELLAGGPRSEKGDLFALGVLFHELATGGLPFGGEDGDEKKVRERHEVGPAPDPRTLRPDLPADFAELTRRLLALDPAERGPSSAEVERSLRLGLGRPRRTGRRVGLVLLVLALALAGWWFATRDDRGSGAPDDGGRDAVAPRRPQLVIARWTALDGSEAGDDATLIRDLLQLHMAAEDPGSALLVTHASTASGEDLLRITGSAGRARDRWEVRWQPVGGEPQTRTAGDLVTLTRTVVRVLGAEAIGASFATTLCDSEPALRHFVAGVRACGRGELAVARERLAAAEQEGVTFPEANAWLAAVLLLESDIDGVSNRMRRLSGVATRPATVLVKNLGPNQRDRSARWGQDHLLARLVDLLLAWHDPMTLDAELARALERDGHAGLPVLAEATAVLAITAGDARSARAAIERFKSLGGAPWRQAGLERATAMLHDSSAGWDLYDWLHRQQKVEGAPPLPDDAWRALRIGDDLDGGRLKKSVRRASEVVDRSEFPRFDISEFQRTAAITLAVGGRFDDALSVAGTVHDPFDYGAAPRLRAAIHALRGHMELARAELVDARRLDPQRGEPTLLLAFLESIESMEPFRDPPESDLERWEHEFGQLAAARRARVRGAPDQALALLGEELWVDLELRPHDWPELWYLRWLERIAALAETGDRKQAGRELQRFRDWWPEERPAASRVSIAAREVEAIVASGGEGD